MKIIAFSMCAALASFAGPALADEGLTQGPANVSGMQCSALSGSVRIDCEQRVLGPDDGNQSSEKQLSNDVGAADLSGAADSSVAESAQDRQDQSSRQASASTDDERSAASRSRAAARADAGESEANAQQNCPRD
jgi:hypothetical protein